MKIEIYANLKMIAIHVNKTVNFVCQMVFVSVVFCLRTDCYNLR